MESSKSLNVRLQNCKNELNSTDKQLSLLRKRRKELLEEINLIETRLTATSESQNEDTFMTTNFSWSSQAQTLLESVFKLKKFRKHQLASINATLSGHDVLLIMPTGGGKSLCFQLTAVITKGLTLVVSPLISLMEDQLNGLQELGIPTAILNSNTSREQSSKIMSSLGNTNDIPYRILYVTPEKLAKSKKIMAQLEKCYANKHFKLLVIDEVHCCSHWGHDFRTDYQFLGIMRNQFPDTPILGLTATATPMVIEDVQKILNIKGCYVFKDSFFRDNLIYSIDKVDNLKKEELVEKIVHLIKKKFAQKSGIIYCLSIKEVEELTDKLRSSGIQAMPYHAQMQYELRKKSYYKWFHNKAQVIVATVAFGMGINKNDVRFVLHYCMSKSFENYYQETGRAGRDGELAECILYFKFADVFRATSLVFSERNGLTNVYSMLAFCLNESTCRKKQISDYFSDNWIQQCNNRCDNCIHSVPTHKVDTSKDMEAISKILAHASRQDKKLTFPKLIDIWMGKGEKKLRPEGIEMKTPYTREMAQQVVGFLLIDQYLKEEFHFTPYSTISYVNIGPSWLTRTHHNSQPISYTLPQLANNNINRQHNTEKTTTKKTTTTTTTTARKRKHQQMIDLDKGPQKKNDYDVITLD